MRLTWNRDGLEVASFPSTTRAGLVLKQVQQQSSSRVQLDQDDVHLELHQARIHERQLGLDRRVRYSSLPSPHSLTPRLCSRFERAVDIIQSCVRLGGADGAGTRELTVVLGSCCS